MCQEDKASSPQLFLMFAVDRKRLSMERVALDRERVSTARKNVFWWFGLQSRRDFGLWASWSKRIGMGKRMTLRRWPHFLFHVS